MFEDSLIYAIKNSFIKGEEERGKGGERKGKKKKQLKAKGKSTWSQKVGQ